MGRRDLPNMYARAKGHAPPEGECRHIRLHMLHIVCYVTLPALQKSAKLSFHCTAPLYNDGCYQWLWVFNSNVSMTFIKIHK